MIEQNDKILVCVSGGKDSLSLLHTLKQYQFYARAKVGWIWKLALDTILPYNLINYCYNEKLRCINFIILPQYRVFVLKLELLPLTLNHPVIILGHWLNIWLNWVFHISTKNKVTTSHINSNIFIILTFLILIWLIIISRYNFCCKQRWSLWFNMQLLFQAETR